MKPTVTDLFLAAVSGSEKILQITAGSLLTEINDHLSVTANRTLQPAGKLCFLGCNNYRNTV